MRAELIPRKSSGSAGGPPKFDGSGNILSGCDPSWTIDDLPLLCEVEERAGERRCVVFCEPLSPALSPLRGARETRSERDEV
jgi:hypothetical protein